jgi:branched-chain amino acid transport system substrate-binding protein
MDRIKAGSKSGWKLGLLLTVILCFGVITFIYPLDTVKAEFKLAGKEVRIGAAFGMTGIWSSWNQRNMIAAGIAIDEINNVMGGIGGVPVKFIMHDTASKPPEAARVVRKLAEDDKVLTIVGPLSSSECEVAFPVGNRLGISMIAQASSKPGISEANRPYGFRNSMDQWKMLPIAVKAFIAKYNVKKVVVVHDIKDANSRFLGTKVLPTVFKKAGVTIVNEGNFLTFQTRDFDYAPQVTKLKGMDFDGIAFAGLWFDAVAFQKELRRQGLKQKVVGGSPLIDEKLPQQGGMAVEGTFAPATFHPSQSPTGFATEYRRRGGERPDMYDINVYDIIYFMKYAMEKMGITNRPEDLAKDREKIMQGLTTIKDFRGIVGSVAFDKLGDGQKAVFVAEVKDGQWVVR